MKYAVLTSGGKQYKVSVGEILEVEHLESEKDQKITFTDVLLYADGESVYVGTPYVEGAKVESTVVDHIRGEKIRVAKFKAKARYRRVTGHRQSLTRLKIDAIMEKKTKSENISSKSEKTR